MATYYVSKTGNDSNPGTFTLPKLTVNAGIGLLSSGDTLYIRSGIYDEKIDTTIVSIPNGSSWSAATTIKAYAGERVTITRGVIVITRSYIIFDGINVDHRLTGTTSEDTGYYISGSDHIRFQNAEVQYALSKGIQTSLGFAGPSTDLQFLNLNIHHTGWGDVISAHHIYFSAGGAGAGVGAGIDTNIIVDGCSIHHTNGVTYSTGVAIAPQTGIMLGVIVRNCLIHDNGIGMQTYGGASECLIYNNILYSNGPNPAIAVDTSSNEFYNNTCWGNSSGIVISGASNVLRNNLSPVSDGGSGNTLSNNRTPVSGDFVDASNLDFHLQTGSPAIDGGFNLSSIFTTDYDGNTRPAGAAFDIGAYEYGSTGGTGGVIDPGEESPPPLPPPLGGEPPTSGGGTGSGGGTSGGGTTTVVAPLSATNSWLVLGRLFLDSGVVAFSDTRVRHPEYIYEPFVIEWGYIDRSIAIVSGLPQVSYGTIRLANTYRFFQDLLFDQTARRRYIDIKLVPEGGSEGSGVLLFTGEVEDIVFGPGYIEISLKDRLFAWLDEPIPAMLIKELYPDIPPENEGGFLPIICGQMRSIGINDSPPPAIRGTISLPHFGTISNIDRYGLSMTPIFDLVGVYRRATHLEGTTDPEEQWELVDPSEYTITEVETTAFNVVMQHQFLDFKVNQNGAEIRADIDGIKFRGAWGPLAATSVSPPQVLRNPIDFFINVTYFVLQKAGLSTQVFDTDEIAELRDLFETGIDSPPSVIYRCDGAVTEPITCREFLGRFLPSFNLFMCQNSRGLITLRFVDAENIVRPVFSEGKFILRESFLERLPEKVATQIVYRYQENPAERRFETWGIYDTAEQNVLGQFDSSSPDNLVSVAEKEVLDLPFVREQATATDITVRRSQFLALGSYRQEWSVPIPPTMADLDLGRLVGITHSQGLAAAGYTNQEVFIYGITANIGQFRFDIRSIRRVPQHISNPLVAGLRQAAYYTSIADFFAPPITVSFSQDILANSLLIVSVHAEPNLGSDDIPTIDDTADLNISWTTLFGASQVKFNIWYGYALVGGPEDIIIDHFNSHSRTILAVEIGGTVEDVDHLSGAGSLQVVNSTVGHKLLLYITINAGAIGQVPSGWTLYDPDNTGAGTPTISGQDWMYKSITDTGTYGIPVSSGGWPGEGTNPRALFLIAL